MHMTKEVVVHESMAAEWIQGRPRTTQLGLTSRLTAQHLVKLSNQYLDQC